FAVYFHPPYAKRGGFGDHGESGPNRPEKLMLLKYANALRDPVLYWQSEQITPSDGIESKLQVRKEDPDWLEWFVEDVFSVLIPSPVGLEPKSPAGMPGSKWLRDIGWVGMHSALGDAANDVWALFKSSRYGSFSHSHADQNSFQLNAYGQPLLIDSGYYPWFGSPHHNLWTRQTRAHNAVLVNGRGQASSSMAAAGNIGQYQYAGKLTLAVGDATAAYNVPMGESTVEQWREILKDLPLPPSGPRATAARRALAFSGEGDKAWLAVSDYVAAESPTRFQFLLHALDKLELDQAGGSVVVTNGPARCLVKIVSTGSLAFSQNDRFYTPPEERYEGAANQWHFTAETTEDAPFARFVALAVPFRAGEPLPEVKEATEGNLRGFEINGERVSAWWGEGETGAVEGFEGPGRLFVETADGKYVLK
ncbi:MAG TPA: heparinase II/III-family protein, partial [Candidatus Glassbacteria bacterium]|nr:heparinase II/III-family protein [Candidatus Glassbacteria bacterium]